VPSTVSDAVDITNASLVIFFIFTLNIHHLKPTSEFFVRSLLSPTVVNLLIIVIWWTWWSSRPTRSFLSPRSFSFLRHLHMIQPVCFDGFVVEPRTIT
jgi:hypothetical protein